MGIFDNDFKSYRWVTESYKS